MAKGKGAGGTLPGANTTEKALWEGFETSLEPRPAASQEAVLPERRKAVKPELQVSLTIKVPQSYRNHWVASAKLDNSNLTREIVKFLEGKYGLPKRRA